MIIMANTVIPNKLQVRPIIALTLGINAALMLANIEYWTPRANNTRAKNWIYKSEPDLCLETGLSRDQQERCTPILINHDFIEYRIAGGNVRHFRLKPDVVENYEKTQRLNPTLLCDIAARKCGRKSHTITIRLTNNKQGDVNNKNRSNQQPTQYKAEPSIKPETVTQISDSDNSEPQSTKGYELAKQAAESLKAKQSGKPP